jgi:glyoxylase I family protein
MIRGIHHTSISTQDFERLVAFYRDVVGLELVASYGWDRTSPDAENLDKIVGLKGSSTESALFRIGNTHLEIFRYVTPVGKQPIPDRPACDAGLTHVAFDVIDIFAEYDRLRKAGVPFHTEPQTVGLFRSTYGRDPDGNIFELQEVLDPRHPVALENLLPDLGK